jgi:Cu+-exporting ATPase
MHAFLLQDEVTAGTVNYNGTMTVEARRAGGDTVMSDIVRMVEDAQTREAPVQRLADTVYLAFIVSAE